MINLIFNFKKYLIIVVGMEFYTLTKLIIIPPLSIQNSVTMVNMG